VAITPSLSSTTTPDEDTTAAVDRLVVALNGVLLGKERQVRLAVACLFARGHLLIEDLPGMGKTLLSHALARALGLRFNRVQFTSDLLPGDILGVSVFDRELGEFKFVAGPVFAQVVLADEINRATPKTQSALLEAMEEQQVTVEGETRKLPEPFFVIATQNPATQSGTFVLPESQLDRFLMRIELGYPDPAAERELLRSGDRRRELDDLQPVMTLAQLASIQSAADAIRVADPVVDYVQRLVHFSRSDPDFAYGLSPRGALAILRAARAWALLHHRSHVVPDDIQVVLPAVVEHRVRSAADHAGHGGSSLARKLLTDVDVLG
jgi:MoxR-like ATPase